MAGRGSSPSRLPAARSGGRNHGRMGRGGSGRRPRVALDRLRLPGRLRDLPDARHRRRPRSRPSPRPSPAGRDRRVHRRLRRDRRRLRRAREHLPVADPRRRRSAFPFLAATFAYAKFFFTGVAVAYLLVGIPTSLFWRAPGGRPRVGPRTSRGRQSRPREAVRFPTEPHIQRYMPLLPENPRNDSLTQRNCFSAFKRPAQASRLSALVQAP